MLMQVMPTFQLNAAQLIGAGIIPIGDYHFPSKLAKFVDGMRLEYAKDLKRCRKNRRLGVLGNIDTVNSATSSALAIQWDVARSSGLPTALRAVGPTNGTTTSRQQVNYTFNTTGAGTINQVAQRTVTIGTSATSNIDMVTWTVNVVGDASATFSAYREIWIELLTTTQGGGASASSILMGNHATNAWDNVLSATGTYTLASGGIWLMQDQTTAGIGVTAGDLLKTVNNDASNAASVRMTAVGYK